MDSGELKEAHAESMRRRQKASSLQSSKCTKYAGLIVDERQVCHAIHWKDLKGYHVRHYDLAREGPEPHGGVLAIQGAYIIERFRYGGFPSFPLSLGFQSPPVNMVAKLVDAISEGLCDPRGERLPNQHD